MHRRKILVFTAASVISALCVYLVLENLYSPEREDSVRRPLASVCFHSYSNSPTGEKWALLTVSNRDTCELIFVGPYTLEFTPFRTNDDVPGDQARWQVPALVAHGSACMLALKLPPDQRRWKAGCFLVRYPLQDKVKERLPDRISWVIPGTHGWQMDRFTTDWISR
jgi:hypothetical protein